MHEIAAALARLQAAVNRYGYAKVTAVIIDGDQVQERLRFEAQRDGVTFSNHSQPGLSHMTINGIRILT